MKKIKIILLALIVYSISFSENNKYGFDFGAGIGYGNYNELFFPIPTVSFYWFTEKRIHQLSSEIMAYRGYSENSYKDQLGFGLGYSCLYKLAIPSLYVGPTLGLYMYNSTKAYGEGAQAVYGFGIKAASIWGAGKVRFKIDDRLLLGIDSEGVKYLLMNNFNISLILAL
jgi:hypothetical protein